MDNKNYIALTTRAFSNAFNWETYAAPEYFYLLCLIPVFVFWTLLKSKKDKTVLRASSISFLGSVKPTLKENLRFVPSVLQSLAFILLVFAIARPQDNFSWEEEEAKGIDIIIAMDVSSSMLARDFEPNRIEASKEIASEFILGRSDDRFGLVVFAGESFTQCPLTIDHDRLVQLFDGVGIGILEGGTAIGLGLATSIKRLKDSKAESKVVILLTDGENNAGDIAPEVAADLAKRFGIRVYTIGVAKRGMAEFPVSVNFMGDTVYKEMKVVLDEKLLVEVAQKTGGKYFRATGNNHLKDIYEEINELEKTELASLKYSSKTELYLPFSALAFLLLLCSKSLDVMMFKKLTVS